MFVFLVSVKKLAFCSYVHESQRSLKYGEHALEASVSRLDNFKKENEDNVPNRLLLYLKNEQLDGHSIGVLKNLATNKNSKKVITKLIGKKYLKIHGKGDEIFALWLWTEKKSKNKRLNKIVRFYCADKQTFLEIVENLFK